jgi:hypothetical protein
MFTQLSRLPNQLIQALSIDDSHTVGVRVRAVTIPASMGRPFVTNFCSDRANTKGSTGRMQGLKMVSTPPKYTRNTMVMELAMLPRSYKTGAGAITLQKSAQAAAPENETG